MSSEVSKAHLEFMDKYPTRNFSARRTFLYQGEIPRSGYMLRNGTIRVYSLNVMGEESNITFLKEDAVVPLEYIFGRAPSSLYYYEAATDIELAVIPPEDIKRELESNNDLQRAMMESLITKYVGSHMHIHALEQTKAREKVVHILQYLVMRFGRKLADGKWLIDLPLKQHEIANMIGVTRETTASELGKLKKSGTVSYSTFLYTVDMEALTKLVGQEDWNEIEIG